MGAGFPIEGCIFRFEQMLCYAIGERLKASCRDGLMPPLDIENTIVLLAAGASCPAGVPTAVQMTDRMLDAFGSGPLQCHYHRTTRMVIGALQMASGLQREVSQSNIDIELLVNAVKLLGGRFETELSPFVGGWHPYLEESERTYIAIPFSDIRKVAGEKNANEEIARLISQPLDGRLFRDLLTILTAKLMHITWLSDRAKPAYLNPLLKMAKTTRLIIATLNYDNTVEIAADALQIPCHTLGEWQRTAVLPEPSTGIDLLKLHGSTNWKWSDRPPVSTGITPPRTVQEVSFDDMPARLKHAKMYNNSEYVGDSLGVLFGGGNKLTAEGPFMDLFYKFKRLLWEKQHLFVIGYSFRDDHINHLIGHWFTEKPDTKLTIVDLGGNINNHPFCRAHKKAINSRLFYDNSGVEKALRRYCPSSGSSSART